MAQGEGPVSSSCLVSLGVTDNPEVQVTTAADTTQEGRQEMYKPESIETQEDRTREAHERREVLVSALERRLVEIS